ncbi:MAG: hypothetical protein RL641_502, partial [Candidatus Parcubacteria bacterium]
MCIPVTCCPKKPLRYNAEQEAMRFFLSETVSAESNIYQYSFRLALTNYAWRGVGQS